MSTAEGWDLTVPDDEAELLAELRRHGVVPGKRFHVVEAAAPRAGEIEQAPKVVRRAMPFIGSTPGGPRDLAAKTDEYLAQGFGR